MSQACQLTICRRVSPTKYCPVQPTEMYRTLKLQSSWSNEWVFDEHENPIAPGARELADGIAAELERQLECVTDVSQHSFYGWGFTTQFDHASFYHVLNPSDPVYLTIGYRNYWLDWLLLRRPLERFDRYMSLLIGVVKNMPKVTDVQSVLRMTKYSRPSA